MFPRDSILGKYFKDDTFTLRHYYDTQLKVTLSKTYDLKTGLSLAIYDEKKAGYREIFAPETFDDLLEFINGISVEFNKIIPASFIARTDEFLAGLPRSFDVSVNWDGSDIDRGEGTKNFDVFQARRNRFLVQPYFYGAYFPGSKNPKRRDAFYVHYNFGKHGGNSQYASSSDTTAYDRVWGIMDDALETVPTDEGRKKIEDFGHKLMSVHWVKN